MCGIVGYTGFRQCTQILLEGLQSLEYRGYDSAGIALVSEGKLSVEKAEGRLSVLSSRLENKQNFSGTCGVGHTRWATHGRPSDKNAHPHVNEKGTIAVVHNGICENEKKLRKELIEKGYSFVSDTDTEVFAHLLDYYYKGNMIDAIYKMMRKVEGSYALGVVCTDDPDTIYAVRKDSPLVIGISKDESFLASDVPAILKYTREVYYPDDGEVVTLCGGKISVLDSGGEPIQIKTETIRWDSAAAEKGGYPHFMLKEIMEQPRAMADTIFPRLEEGITTLSLNGISEDLIKGIDKIFLVACGSAYHVSVSAKYIFENMTGISTEVDLASEFRYRSPIINERTLIIVISQSGETADTIAALREAKRRGAKVLSVVNVVGSTIAKESDAVFYTWAGPEIAVATTKAYSAQLCAIYVLSLYFAAVRNKINLNEVENLCRALRELPNITESILKDKKRVQVAASKLYSRKSIFFIGRGLSYAAALEGSLKLKEISYIHSEAYAAGELKHGTISLIEEGTPVVCVIQNDSLKDKMRSNMREVKARGAFVLAIKEKGVELSGEADMEIELPGTHQFLWPSLAILPLQLLAYYVALMRGCDIDKPRNLAKSVTVE